AFVSASLSFLPESECKSIADFRTAQAFRELFFRNVCNSLIMRKINFKAKIIKFPMLAHGAKICHPFHGFAHHISFRGHEFS
ncbi:MAG: hypothetical protein KBT22_04815, partial [Bacteroidales bacterium]|nr:hypothetical protein [Candidatus Scybalocola fimicaballi]